MNVFNLIFMQYQQILPKRLYNWHLEGYTGLYTDFGYIRSVKNRAILAVV